MGEPAVSPTYCPINGAYQFTYSVKDGTECSAYTSDISDCPYGYGFNLKFNGCSFGDMDMAFHCLGNFHFISHFFSVCSIFNLFSIFHFV